MFGVCYATYTKVRDADTKKRDGCLTLKLSDFRRPKNPFKIDDLVVAYFYPFAFEQLLHQVRTVEMVFARKHADSVHDAMCGNVFGTIVHRPTDHSCRTRRSDSFCDGTVRRDFSVWNLLCDFVDALKKVLLFHLIVVLDDVAQCNQSDQSGDGTDYVIHVLDDESRAVLHFFEKRDEAVESE